MQENKKKKGGWLKILGIVVVIIIAMLFMSYLVWARPFFKAQPLADIVPDDASFYASVDMVNGARTAKDFINAIGRKRFMDLIKEPEKKDEKKEENKEDKGFNPMKAFKFTRRWITREVMVLGSGIPSPDNKNVAVLIGSHNAGKAEDGFPQLLDMIKEKKVEYDKKEYKTKSGDTINVYCMKVAPGQQAKPEDSLCWASTKRALVVSLSREYIQHIADSIYGERTERQKYLKELHAREIAGNHVAYLFVSLSGPGGIADGIINSMAAEKPKAAETAPAETATTEPTTTAEATTGEATTAAPTAAEAATGEAATTDLSSATNAVEATPPVAVAPPRPCGCHAPPRLPPRTPERTWRTIAGRASARTANATS